MHRAVAALASHIRYGVEAGALMLQGVEQLTDAVQVTMGRKGRTVVIEQSYGFPTVTKDGVTVATSIEFKGKLKNVGAALAKSVANATYDVAGDDCKSVAAGMNAMGLRRGITLAVDAVVSHLKSQAKMISTSEEIAQVGTLSANGDREIGESLAGAMEKVTVSDGKTLFNELEVVEGMRLDRGYISPYFITNTKTQKVELENPVILIHEKKITGLQAILPILELVVRDQRPLFIVVEDFESQALATLIVNKLRGGVNVCEIKAPGFGESRKSILQDLAVLTGGQVISKDLGYKLENIEPDMLGPAKKATVSKDDTIILDGAGDKAVIEERTEQLKSSSS